MLYYFRKDKNAAEMQKKKKICVVYGVGAVNDEMCQKWFVKFCIGEFSLDDAPRSGGPVEVDSYQIETLTENSQHYRMWERADILQISKSRKLLLEMKNLSFILQKNLNGFVGQPSRIRIPRHDSFALSHWQAQLSQKRDNASPSMITNTKKCILHIPSPFLPPVATVHCTLLVRTTVDA